MSYYSRNNGLETRSRERDNHYRRRDRDRERSWNRETERPKSSFRGRDLDYSDRGDHRRYRPPSRDEKIVLVRRDRERDEDKKERTPKEIVKHKEIKPTHHISIPRSPVPEKNKELRSKHKSDQRENGRLPDSVTQNAGSVARSHTSHVASKSNVSVKEEICHPIIPHVSVNGKETFSKPSVSNNQVIINSSKTHPHPVVDRKEIGSKFTVPVNQVKYNQTPTPSRIDKEDKKLNPVQQELVERCFSNCKIRGDYDKIRRECMLDIDTKPAFINARAKVMDITERFLQKARYHPHMDKAKLRENLKKSFELSKGYEAGLESLVNQILLPKIPGVVRPIIEAEVHRCLGMRTPTPSDKNSNSGCDIQQSQPINKCVNKDCPKTIGEITEGTTSCLPPMNVIMDSEPVSTSSKKSRDQLLGNYFDKQLHEDIQEELNEESVISVRPHFEVRFSEEIMKEERSAANHGRDIEMQAMDVDVIVNAEGNVELNNQSSEASNTNIESEVVENLNDCIAVETETGATQEKRLEDAILNDIEMQGHTYKLVVEESPQSISPIDDETVKDIDDNDMDEDSDEESPEFEKIGEVSPVRIDSLPDFEIPNCDTFVPQPVEQPCLINENIVKPECTNSGLDAAKKSESVSRLVEGDHTVLRIL